MRRSISNRSSIRGKRLMFSMACHMTLLRKAPTLAAGSVVVASARKMLVRLGLCGVGIDSIVLCGFRRTVCGRFALRAGWRLRARLGLRGVERLVSRLRGRLGGHGVLLR
jgi:hypothetical protein